MTEPVPIRELIPVDLDEVHQRAITVARWAQRLDSDLPVAVKLHLSSDVGAMATEVESLRAVVEHVRRLHRGPRTERHGSGCVQCGIVWPCPTALAVGLTEADRKPVT